MAQVADAMAQQAETDAVSWRIAKMLRVLSEDGSIDAREIAATDRLDRSGLDHVTLPMLLIHIEDEFDVTIGDEEVKLDSTFGAVVALVVTRMGDE